MNQVLGRYVDTPGVVQVQSHMVAFPTQDPKVLSFAARVLKQIIDYKLHTKTHEYKRKTPCLSYPLNIKCSKK